ncbi:MAG: protein kinase [Chlamydiota bacterium]|nr:protein kinase [Chlamydiota bacterium]
MTREELPPHQSTIPKPRQSLEKAPSALGPYEPISLLHSREDRKVFLAKGPLGCVALKVAPKSNLISTQSLKREASLLASISHQNIVQSIEYGEDHEYVYLAMHYIEGIPLTTLNHTYPLNRSLALSLLLKIAAALLYLHTEGIIHRDIKPNNVIYMRSGNIQCIDFGIAVSIEDSPSSKPRHPTGTPYYMSPEQKLNQSAPSFSDDIYSFGMLAKELLMGPPKQHPILWSSQPQAIQHFLHKATAHARCDRYLEITDLIIDLKELIAQPSHEVNLCDQLTKGKNLLLSQDHVDRDQIDHSTNLDPSSLNTFHGLSTIDESHELIWMGKYQRDPGYAPWAVGILTGLIEGMLLDAKTPLSHRLQSFTQSLIHYHPDLRFAFHLIQLDHGKQEMAWWGCDVPPLLHFMQGQKEAHSLENRLPSLGSATPLPTSPTIERWQEGDLIIASLSPFRPSISSLFQSSLPLSASGIVQALNQPDVLAIRCLL